MNDVEIQRPIASYKAFSQFARRKQVRNMRAIKVY